MFHSVPISFPCGGVELHGLIELPAQPARRAVLVIVGGPQYRIGSHRQFTLLCRFLAAQGVPAMRFDHRGIGDSDGETTFEHLDLDIRAAINSLQRHVTEVDEIVLWGLCDAASAAMMYAALDSRVKGLVLLNPWIRSEQTLAQAYLKGYYISRLFDASFWRRVFRAEVSPVEALRSFWSTTRAAFGRRQTEGPGARDHPDGSTQPFADRMESGLRSFQGPVMFILSGEDITAREFAEVSGAKLRWKSILRQPRVTQKALPAADHTFSRKQWSEQVEQWTLDWLRSW